MRYIFLFLAWTLVIITKSYGQQGNVWVFGSHAGIDFNSGSPVVTLTAIEGFGEANASVCDADGQLLFYTEGSKVWNRNHLLMSNGSDLTPISVPSSMSALSSVTTSTAQGAVIVPMPDSPNKYYIFSLTSFELQGDAGKLYYSILDMNLDGGMGNIVPGQKGIFLSSGLSESMVATLGDACNVWLITRSANGLVYKAYEITTTGINLVPVLSNIGTNLNENDLGFHLAVSPNRKLFSSGRALYYFDALTGELSGPISLFPNPLSNDTVTYGVCFSADNSKLYVNVQQSFWANSHTFQFDLSSGNAAAINTSAVHVGYPFSATDLKMGPDGKIYFISMGGDVGNLPVTTLGRIEQPNLAGTACQYVVNALPLNLNCAAYFGLPSVVPVFKRDTLIQAQSVVAPCFIDEIILSPLVGGNNFLWSDGTTGDQLTVNQSGTYYVSCKEAPCNYHVDTFHVTMRSLVPVTGFSNPGCIGDSIGIAWVSPAPNDNHVYQYTWKNLDGTLLRSANHSLGDTLKNLPPGTYTARMSGANGCDTTFMFNLPEPGRASFTADTIICIGDALNFHNTSTNDYFTAWAWDFGDGMNASVYEPVHTFQAAGNYQVRLIANKEPCVDTAYLQIIVDPVSQVLVTKEKDNICKGDKIKFIPQQDSTVISYLWNFGDGTEWLIQSGNNVAEHAYAEAGIMYLNLTAHFRACPDINYQDSVMVYSYPYLDLGQDSSLCINGHAISLYNHAVQEPGAYQYLWSTGEQTSNISVVHPDEYSLTMINEHGCATTAVVTVKKDCYIDIPNAFTPNEDGQNDYFFPRQMLSHKVKKFTMQVLNRWGQLVFETNRTDGRGWDGKFNNQDQPEGVYIYLIAVEVESAPPEKYQGNVTLIR
jgi:gliding motility-associated-like protein